MKENWGNTSFMNKNLLCHVCKVDNVIANCPTKCAVYYILNEVRCTARF